MRKPRSVLSVALGAAMLVVTAPGLLTAGDGASTLTELGAVPLAGSDELEADGMVVGVLPGADDFDASRPYVLLSAAGAGREAALAAAKVVAALDLGRSVAVALWPGGATVVSLPVDKLAAVIDVSGAVGGSQRLQVSAVGSSTVWPRLLERANVPVGLDLEISDAPDLSQALPVELFGREVPGLQLGTPPGVEHDDDLSRVARLAALLVYKASRLPEAPTFARAEERTAESSPAVTRIFTGTIPDYAADVAGLRLSGVIEGGPAAAAGLLEGDVIVALGEWSIGDVYEYADALDKLVPDEPLTVVFLRDGERLEATIIPRSRR